MTELAQFAKRSPAVGMELFLNVCLLLLRFSIIHGVGSIQDLTETLNDMNTSLQEVKSSISDVRSDVVVLEERFDLDLKFAKLDLNDYVTKTIVPMFVRSQVERALEDVLRTRSVDSLINSHVMNSLQRLKKAQHVLKNRLQLYVERISKVERGNILIKAELTKVEHRLVDSRHVIEVQSSEILNLTLKLNETCAVGSLAKQDDSDMSTERKTITSSFVPTVVSSESQSQYNMSRVLYMSIDYNSVPQQLSLKNNHLQTFPLDISNVRFHAVVFEPTSRKIIFSVGDQNHTNVRLCSSDVEGGAVQLIRWGIQTGGLAVDTIRNVIFMTTLKPARTISRMRPDGSYFRVVADMSWYGSPYNIAVVPDKQLIYSAHWDRVLETSYDGVVRQIIDTGRQMLALDYDTISHKLYYNNEKILNRWSPGNEASIPIHNFTNGPLNFRLYRNSLYIGYDYDKKELGVVFLNKEDAVYRKLAESPFGTLWLCLIP